MANIQDNLVGVAVPAAELSLEVLRLMARLIKESLLMTSSITKGTVKASGNLLKTTAKQGKKVATKLNKNQISIKELMQKNDAVENINLPANLKNKFKKIAAAYHTKYAFVRYKENDNDMISMVYRKKDADKINIVMQKFLKEEKIKGDILRDSDGDHVPDREDYRPLDPSIQKASDDKINNHRRKKNRKTVIEYVDNDTRMSTSKKNAWVEDKLKESYRKSLRGIKEPETFEVKKQKATERMEKDREESKTITEILRDISKEKSEERSV